ncbi:hypothetical protein BT67DRAFT_448105 [Trichocladium antarcticum]|uniref:Uncharacterized protein n=1 Tax=Trichocladium antarcticum TaxID=1450529 RepID=A0AAN6UPS4_9PEZI|nr:hypothetical protein BT67DRAFT_448105 [Trichocladium antarcticum]
MLSRPAFSIRKLIPQKKQDGTEDYEGSYFYHDEQEMDTLSRIKTWRPPMGLMKRSKPSIDIRRSEDLHRNICIPPLPDTPQSSTTSLCSCDNGTGYAAVTSPRSSPPRRPDRSPLSPLASPHSSPQRSPQRSPLLLAQQSFESLPPPSRGRSPVSARSLHPEHLQLTPPSSPPPQAEMAPETPADLPDAAPSTPAAGNRPPSPPMSPDLTVDTPPADTHPVEDDRAAFSQDVMQLIHETDEAFKPRQSLIDAILPDQELAKFPKLKGPSPPSPLARRKSQRRSQGSVKSVKSPIKASMKDPLLPAQARLPSNSRPKRAKSKKSRRRPPAPTRQSSMWQLTESAKDLFTIRIFHRLEVDEMLPESTLREIRMSRSAHWTRSPELGVTHVDNKSTVAATPIEPQSPDDSLDNVDEEEAVTPRASVVNQAAEIDREACKTPSTSPPELVIATEQECGGLEQAEDEAGQISPLLLQQPDSPTTKPCDEEDDDGSLPIMTAADDEPHAQRKPIEAKPAVSPVPPPLKSPLHRRHPSRQLPPLPTIPEILVTGSEEATLSPTSMPQPFGAACKVNKDDYIFLEATRCTLTVPTFKHGPIRLAKADLPIGKLAAAVDDTLDWTAFQMAILGGAGDFFSEPTDYSRPSEAELNEREELAAWFCSLGFESPGALVGPPEPRTPTQPWSPVLPRTPALSPPSPTSTPGSSPRTVMDGRSPRFMRIDPPAPGNGSEPSALKSEFGDSIAGRFFPIPQLGSGARGGGSKHRRSASSTTFGQPLVPEKPLSFESRNHIGLAIDSRRRPSIDSTRSLPQSPMMDLVVSHDVEGNEYRVPMGFNLSHDLGDFLNWHTEHISGGGFSMSDGNHV